MIPRDGRPLGLIIGKGVEDLRAMTRERRADKPLNTAAEFEDFMSSYRPWVTYVRVLRQFLPEPRFDCILYLRTLRH